MLLVLLVQTFCMLPLQNRLSLGQDNPRRTRYVRTFMPSTVLPNPRGPIHKTVFQDLIPFNMHVISIILGKSTEQARKLPNSDHVTEFTAQL